MERIFHFYKTIEQHVVTPYLEQVGLYFERFVLVQTVEYKDWPELKIEALALELKS